MNTKELDNQYVAHAYGRFDVALTKGQGSTLYDEDGKKYIDFGSGIGVTAFGINDPVWTKAVEEQLHDVMIMWWRKMGVGISLQFRKQ